MRLAITAKRVELIKKIWRSGMSATQIAKAVNAAEWGGRPSRNAIVGMFDRWGKQLEPCYLTAQRRLKQTNPKPLPGPPRKSKNTKNINTGYVAREPGPKLYSTERKDYGLTEEALKKHLHEERMLARDRENIRSPAVRAGEGKHHNSGRVYKKHT
jgi:hypothetical protein